MLDDLVNSLDDSSDTEPSAMLRQIVMPNGDIPNLKDNVNSLKDNGNFLGDRP